MLLAPPPEQTPPNVDPSRIDVGRVLGTVDFKDLCVTVLRAAASLAETFVFRCCSFMWSRRSRGSSAFDHTWRRTTVSRLNGRPTNPAACLEVVRQWALRLWSLSDRPLRRSLRSLSREASASSSWAFDVRSTCSDRGLDRLVHRSPEFGAGEGVSPSTRRGARGMAARRVGRWNVGVSSPLGPVAENTSSVPHGTINVRPQAVQ